MANNKFLELTRSGKLKGNTSFNDFSDTSENFFITLGQRNDDKDNQIISHANKISDEVKQRYGENKSGFAFGLYMTYTEIVNEESKMNKLTQEYVKHNFKDEPSFRCYFMRHKNAPKFPLDERG